MSKNNIRVVFLEAETVIQTPGMKTKSEAEPNFALSLRIAIFTNKTAKVVIKNFNSLSPDVRPAMALIKK